MNPARLEAIAPVTLHIPEPAESVSWKQWTIRNLSRAVDGTCFAAEVGIVAALALHVAPPPFYTAAIAFGATRCGVGAAGYLACSYRADQAQKLQDDKTRAEYDWYAEGFLRHINYGVYNIASGGLGLEERGLAGLMATLLTVQGLRRGNGYLKADVSPNLAFEKGTEQ